MSIHKHPLHSLTAWHSMPTLHFPVQLSGLGKIRPNTLVVGYKNNWKTCSDEELKEYVDLLQ